MTKKVVETKICKHCGSSFPIYQGDVDMLELLSPVFNDKKFPLPTPTFCPDCRLQRKLVFRNDKKLYRRTCDFSGKEIISMYSPQAPVKVYDHHIRHSDQRDPLSYGVEPDFSQSFFSQFKKLYRSVPQSSLINEMCTNSDYCQHVANMKDCYLVHGSANCEHCYYGYRVVDGEHVYDSTWVNRSRQIYQSVEIDDSTMLRYAQSCKNCSLSRYLYACDNCSNCLCCANLHNASYCIENKQYSKEEYTKLFPQKLKEMTAEKFSTFCLAFPRKDRVIVGSENVVGDGIYHSKNVWNSFNIRDCENVRYSSDLYNKTTNAMDCFSSYGPADKIYETVAAGINSYNNYFLYYCYPAQDAYYCIGCFHCSHIFLCNGLINKSYCILNKQYTKEEYEALVSKIIEKMQADNERGEFFSSHISVFGYNETIANEQFPLTKAEAEKQGFARSDYESPLPNVEKMLKASELPSIQEVTDDVLNQAIICEVTGRPFKIITPELAFYRKHNLPLPTKHPDVRHAERMQLRNPRKLRDRKCDKCGINIKTSYSPERPEVVYCEQCYNKKVYG